MTEFVGKIVVVTGAAGNLGRAVVKAFLEQGATVFGLDYKSGRMADLQPQEESAGMFFPMDNIDVTDQTLVDDAAVKVHQLAGKADILINCLGGFTYGEPVYQMSPETWEWMMSINVGSFLNLTRTFMPDLLEKGSGKVVAVGAGASQKGGVKIGAYSAAKSALLRLVESLAGEVSRKGIQVNCVLPRTIDTPQNRAEMPNADRSTWVSPEELADVILCLSSPSAAHINGVALPIK